MPGDVVTLVSPDKRITRTIQADDAKTIGSLVEHGWGLEQPAQQAERAVDTGLKDRASGAFNAFEAGATAFADGLLLNAPTYIGSKINDAEWREKERYQQAGHPYTRTGGEVLGVITQQVLLPEADAFRAIRGAKSVQQAISLTAKAAARGAAEGAAQTTSKYLATQALEDKPVTAEGFWGAAEPGIIWGGGSNAFLGIGERALTSVKNLWPEAQVTSQAARSASRKARVEIESAINDGDLLEQTARAKVRARGRATAATDPAAADYLAQARYDRLRKSKGGPDLTPGPISDPAQLPPSVAPPLRVNRPKISGEIPAAPAAIQREAGAAPAAVEAGVPVVPPEVAAEVGWPRQTPVDFGDPANARVYTGAGLDSLNDVPTPAATGEVGTVAGKVRPVQPGAVEVNTAIGRRAPDIAPVEGVPVRGPDGTVPYKRSATPDLPEAPPPAPAPDKLSGVPTFESIGPLDEVDAIIPAEALVNRIELPGAMVDKVRANKARKYVAEGLDPKKDPIQLAVHPDGRFEVINGRHRIAAAVEAGKPVPAKVSRAYVPEAAAEAIAPEASALESRLAATNDRLASGAEIGDLAAEGRALDDIARKDPEGAALHSDLAAYTAARNDVRAYMASLRGRADELADIGIASGALSREQDVVYGLSGGRDILAGKLGKTGSRAAIGEDRAVVSRLRNQFTDDELIAQSRARPTFHDTNGDIITSRSELAERIASGRTNPALLEIEDLVPNVDDATGEIRGLTGQRRAATADEILEAVGNSSSGRSRIEEVARRLEPMRGYSDDEIRGLMGHQPAALRGYTDEELAAKMAHPSAQASETADLLARQNPDLGASVTRALRGRVDHAEDIAEAIKVFSRFEQAEANLANRLGPDVVPPGTWRRTLAHQDAVAQHAESRAMASARHASAANDIAGHRVAADLAKNGAGAIEDAAGRAAEAATGGVPKPKGTMGYLADAGAALEVLSTLKIPGIPSAKDIPFIGPLLSLYLKGRAAMGVWKKMGGKVPRSASTEIAARSAATRNRIRTAVLGILDDAGAALGKVSKPAPSVAAVMSRSFFLHENEKPRRHPPDEAPGVMWKARAQELRAAQQPGAVDRMIRSRIQVDDPHLAQEMATAFQRRAAYLSDRIPKAPPGVGTKAEPWHPPPSEAARFVRIVDALDNPAGVFERAAAGDVSIEAMQAVRDVYPKLYQEAQLHLLHELADRRDDIPYQRRVQLGLMFDLPIDATQEADFAAAMQTGYARDQEPPPAPMSPAPAPNAPPMPAIAAPVNLAQNLQLREQSP